MPSVVILAGGSPHAHDFHSIGAALAELFQSHGHDVRVIDHPDLAPAELADHKADALVVAGLWWDMQGDAYDPWRDEHAYLTPQPTREALHQFVAGGGGLIALHTAPVCFGDWDGWGAIVGGAWNWGVSGHPPYGPVTATVIVDHPVVAGLAPEIALDDEIYGGMNLANGITPLAIARRTPDDTDQPVVWTHHFGDGRVVYDGFGHNVATIEHPDNAQILTQALDWVARTS